ncbi:hypothetical protein JST97_04930 [bacterium]|nr:hypothetical protein [bacterium]
MFGYLKESFKAIGEFQSRLILTGFYFLIVPIFALLARMGGDALGFKGFNQSSSWIKRNKGEHTLAEAQRQY